MDRVATWKDWMNSGKKPVVLDGSIGDVLKERGVHFESSKLWAASLLVSDPSCLANLTREYLDAGADIITTATYQATQSLFQNEFQLSEGEAQTTLRSATKILARVRNEFWNALSEHQKSTRRYPKIAASIGPMASWMEGESEYHGFYAHVTREMFEISHTAIAQLLISSNDGDAVPDIIAFETVPSEQEALAIVRIMNQNKNLACFPYWLTFQCRDKKSLANGTTIDRAVNMLLDECGLNLVAVGVNCTSTVNTMTIISSISRILEEHKKSRSQIRLIAYPNGYHRENWAQKVLANCADIVGGCCGADVSYIRDLKTKSVT